MKSTSTRDNKENVMNNQQLRQYFSELRGGNNNAFAAIYNDMKTPVYTVIYRTVGSHETAEDIMQELFLKLFSNPPGNNVKNLRAYIFRSAYNMSVDWLRRAPLTESISDNISDEGSESDLIIKLDIQSALQKLTEQERTSVVLRLNAGLTLIETSRIMNKSTATVHRIYTRALKKLREML